MNGNVWTLAYILGVVAVNTAYALVPPLWRTAWGDVTLGSIVVGLLLLARDRAQEEQGKWRVLFATLAAALLSFLTSSPVVAAASARAFIVSEVADWAVYTPLRKRGLAVAMLASQLVGAGVDTWLFLSGMGGLDVAGFTLMTASKALAVCVLLVPATRSEVAGEPA